ncbi:nucleoside-diphosphate-sugar epimerase [Pedobacter sp. UYP30]|uniref:NAD-dependent epimerase/dehydratase family protein n=1 Tax=Pedobacter sp. UYP30 TaxID=1756400 RepID=UPI0033969835
MKIILTGASGFVGSSLTSFFKDKPEINMMPLSIRTPLAADALKGADCVIHLAGKAHDLKRSSNPAEYYTVNFELTKNLFDAFIKSDAKKFIFMSSVKAAADAVDGVLTEKTLPNPQTDYGKSKLMAEEYIQKQELPEGKSYYILRPCMIHGPGNKGNLNLLYGFVKKGLPYPLAAFENRRSFLSIENLCSVIEKLMTSTMASDVFQVADDDALSTNDVVGILADSLGKKPRLMAIPAPLIESVAKLGDVLRLPINTERLNKLTENYVVSNEKIKSLLGIAFPLTSRQGLEITARSFAKNYRNLVK